MEETDISPRDFPITFELSNELKGDFKVVCSRSDLLILIAESLHQIDQVDFDKLTEEQLHDLEVHLVNSFTSMMGCLQTVGLDAISVVKKHDIFVERIEPEEI